MTSADLFWHPTNEVLRGDRMWAVALSKTEEYTRGLPDKSVDLVFGSPPYEDRRQYEHLKFKLKGQEWVDWMHSLFKEWVRVCKGAVCMVLQGKTDDYEYSCVPHLLIADLKRDGFHMRNPPIFHRVGIAGSGEPDWFRGDYEHVVCCTAEPGRLPWSNNRAVGKPPKYGPGGEMSYRLSDGSKRNQWGGCDKGIGTRRENGEIQRKKRPSHKVSKVRATPRMPDGSRQEQHYKPPTICNPGNKFQMLYTADEVNELLGQLEMGDVRHGKVGGGHMGHRYAHRGEAPMPLWLAEAFVLSLCPPGGVVYDPFTGTGTTAHAAVQNRRRYVGCDERGSQVSIARERLEGVTPLLFVEADSRWLPYEERKRQAREEGDPPLETSQEEGVNHHEEEG